MGLIHHHPGLLATRARTRFRGFMIFGLGMATALRAAPAPPTASPASSSPAATAAATPNNNPDLGEPKPLPADSPEMQARTFLRDYLTRSEPRRSETLAGMNFDRGQTLIRMFQFEQARNFTELADAYLYFLTKFPPDPATYLDTVGKLTGLLNLRRDDPALLVQLFNIARKFPPASPTVQQMRLWEAEYLLSVNLVQPALMTLQELSAQPDVTPAILMIAAGRAGIIHERLGEPAEAVKYYLLSGKDFTAGAQANEAQLRAALLLLELGRTDEGIAELAKLKNVPPDLLRQSPATSRIIADMVALVADPNRAHAYWDYTQTWMPRWRELTTTLGMPPEPPDTPARSAFVDNYQALLQQASLAMSQKDRAAYFQMVDILLRAARWHPGDLLDAAYLLFQGVRLDPEHANQIFALGALLEQNLPPGNEELAKQLTKFRASALIDNGKAEEARDAASAMLAKYGANDEAGQTLARIYGLAVLKSGSVPQYGAQAAKILADTLADPAAHGNQRAFTVAILNDLYASLGRETEQKALLEKEIPALPAADEMTPKLREELVKLQMRQNLNVNLGAGLAAWWAQYQLPWYQYTVTSAKSGPLSTVDEPAVQVVLNIAGALDDQRPLSTRAIAMQDAWTAYPEMPLTGDRVVQAASAYATRNDLPLELRIGAWAKSMWHLLWTGQRAAAAKLLAAAPAEASADDRADYALWIDYLGQPITVEAQKAFAARLMAQPKVHEAGVMLTVRIVDSLARLGAFDEATAVYQNLQTAKLDDTAQRQYQQMSGTMAGLLASYKSVRPAYAELRRIILEARPEEAAKAQLPEAWLNLNNIWMPNLELLSQSDARTGLLAVIRDELPYGRHPLQVFLDYGQSLTYNERDAALRLQLFETAQLLASSDEDRFYAALLMNIVDFDEPAIAKRGWADLAGARVAAYPRASNIIQYYDTLMKWRGGGDVDFTAEFGPLNTTPLDPYRLRLVLDYYLQHQDRDALQKLLQARPNEQEFLHSPVLSAYLRALKLLGREAALTRATDAAQAELARLVVASWAQPESDSAHQVFDIARALNAPTAYPREWVDSLLANIHNENARDLVLIADGRLQKNWQSVLEAADSYLARNPTNYDAYWPKAEALIALGRKSDALAPLRVFLKYSHNEDDYPVAQQQLKKIEAETGKTATASAK